MRGKQPYSNLLLAQVLGSPPHARGAGCGKDHWCGCGGITPACAGSSIYKSCLVYQILNHPRMRGEQQRVYPDATATQGSPPHARGAVADRVPWGQHYGITPACAGSRFDAVVIDESSRDHPRMRGEQDVQAAFPFRV